MFNQTSLPMRNMQWASGGTFSPFKARNIFTAACFRHPGLRLGNAALKSSSRRSCRPKPGLIPRTITIRGKRETLPFQSADRTPVVSRAANREQLLLQSWLCLRRNFLAIRRHVKNIQRLMGLGIDQHEIDI